MTQPNGHEPRPSKADQDDCQQPAWREAVRTDEHYQERQANAIPDGLKGCQQSPECHKASRVEQFKSRVSYAVPKLTSIAQ